MLNATILESEVIVILVVELVPLRTRVLFTLLQPSRVTAHGLSDYDKILTMHWVM